MPLLGAWRSILDDCWVSLNGFWGLRTRFHRVFPSIGRDRTRSLAAEGKANALHVIEELIGERQDWCCATWVIVNWVQGLHSTVTMLGKTLWTRVLSPQTPLNLPSNQPESISRLPEATHPLFENRSGSGGIFAVQRPIFPPDLRTLSIQPDDEVCFVKEVPWWISELW